MEKLNILLAKGRIYDAVHTLLSDAGISIYLADRTYFPVTNQNDLAFQVVKPQVVSALLADGKADLGFCGKDWVFENGVQKKVTEILDLGFDAVRIVAAVPNAVDFEKLILSNSANANSANENSSNANFANANSKNSFSEKSQSKKKGGVKNTPPSFPKKITVATEYQNLSKKWLKEKKIAGTVFRTWGTSEGFLQGGSTAFAQILIDNTSTGSSLRANNLKIVDTIMESSTRMYASKDAMKNAAKRKKILELKMLFEAVLFARGRVMLEMNVSKENFERLAKGLPSMKSPTISPLFGGRGYAVKIAVQKNEIPLLLPKLKSLGAADIVEYELRKVMP